MSKKYVLDSSAVLALLHQEPGHDRVERVLADACLAVVNLAEVYSKLADGGLTSEEASESVGLLGLIIEPMDEEQALEVGRLRAKTRKAALSLGDRNCLALAIRLDATAVTADRIWSKLGLGPILQIR